ALSLRDSVMFVAGLFNGIGGKHQEGLAEISLETAQRLEWNPRASAATSPGAGFKALALSGDTLFVTRYADSPGGAVCVGSVLAAVSASTGDRIRWDPRPNGDVHCVSVSGDQVFAGGAFRSMGPSVSRRGLAAIDLATGHPTSWDPSPDYYVQAIKIVG